MHQKIRKMNKKIGLKEAISIGIGGMVGGGIFAIRFGGCLNKKRNTYYFFKI